MRRRNDPKHVQTPANGGAVLGTSLRLLVQFCLLLAAVVGCVQCLVSLYALTLPMAALWRIMLAMTAVAFAAVSLRRRALLVCTLAVLAGLWVWTHAQALVQGWLLLLEQALHPMELVLPDGWLLLLQPMEDAVAQQRLLYAAASLFALLISGMAMCLFAIPSLTGLLLCLLTPMLPGLITGLVPSFGPAVLLLAVCLVLAAYESAMRAAEDPQQQSLQLEETIVQQRQGAWIAAALCMVPLMLVTLLLSMRLLPEKGYVRPSYAERLRQTVLELDFGSLWEPYNDGLSHGDLTELSDIRFTGDAALAIRSSMERQMYLAGYTAATFTGTAWENPSQSAYQMAAVGFSDPLPQNLHALLPTSADAQTYTLSVRHIDAENDTMYLPNGLVTAVDAIDGASLLQDGALRGTAQTAEAGYTVSALPFYAQPMPLPAAETLSDAYRLAAKTATVGADAALQRSAENYTAYVMATYTQLPEDVRLAAEQLCTLYGLSLEATNDGYDIAALCTRLRTLLRSQCRYAYAPLPTPSGVDFATWFLQQAREGYCVHFATTAAVLLRALGIPTRYAEGYIVIRSDYEKPTDAEGYVLIEDTHAHAWAEVYDPVQMAWIPVEMTPSTNDAPQPTATPETEPLQQTEQPAETPLPTEETTEEPEDAAAQQTPEPTAEPLPESEEQAEHSERLPEELPLEAAPLTEPSATPVDGAQNASEGRSGLLAATVMLLLLSGVVLLRTLVCRHRRAKRMQADANAAVLAVCADARKLLHFAGCAEPAMGQSVPEYAGMLEKTQPWLDAEGLAALLLLGERAAFSAHRCTLSERNEANRLLAAIRARSMASLPFLRRALLFLRFPV